MGGTFDPVHWGHLVAAEEARVQFKLDQVIFMPVGTSPFPKDYPVSSAEHRYAMALLATADHPDFTVSRLEIDRPGPSYTVDTLRALRADGEGMRFWLIVGADAALELASWQRPHELAQLCEVVAVTRPGYDVEELARRLPPELLPRVRVLAIPELNISSTQLRARVARGESVRYLLPAQVAAYIAKCRLYL